MWNLKVKVCSKKVTIYKPGREPSPGTPVSDVQAPEL
jgi:hypothetical protein